MGDGHKVVERDWRVKEHDEDHINHNKPDDAWTTNLSKQGFSEKHGQIRHGRHFVRFPLPTVDTSLP